jgi:hypothetical protein
VTAFAEGLLLGVKGTLRPVGFVSIQPDLAAGLLPLLAVESRGHAQAKGWGEAKFTPRA